MLSPREQQQLIDEALRVFGGQSGNRRFSALGKKFGPFGELLGLVTDTLTRSRPPGPNDLVHAIRLLTAAGFDVRPGGTIRQPYVPPAPPIDRGIAEPPILAELVPTRPGMRGHVVTPPRTPPQRRPGERTPSVPGVVPQAHPGVVSTPGETPTVPRVDRVGRVATVPRIGDLETAWPAEHDINTSTRQAMVERRQDSIFRRSQFEFFPDSSNVYGATYDELEQVAYVIYKIGDPIDFVRKISSCSGRSYRMGIKPNQQGPMYAYGSRTRPFTRAMWTSFLAAPSKGEWVWHNLRVCGSQWEHQIPYNLVNPAVIGGSTVYVPRKATSRGYRSRAVPKPGIGRRGFVRSTLPERLR